MRPAPGGLGDSPRLWAPMPGAGRQREMLCFMPGVAVVPALLVGWSSAAFIISYVIAVLAGHVEPLVPYIR